MADLRTLAQSMLRFLPWEPEPDGRKFVEVRVVVPNGPTILFGAYESTSPDIDEQIRAKHRCDLVLLLARGAECSGEDLCDVAKNMVRIRPPNLDTDSLVVDVVVATPPILWGIFGRPKTPDQEAWLQRQINRIIGEVEAILRAGREAEEKESDR